MRYEDIPITDPYTFREIAKGKTYGVFQLESPGMRSFMTQLYEDVNVRIHALETKHKTQGLPNADEMFTKEMNAFGQELFERLIAGVSLYRPGPMDYIPNYLNGIRNPEKIVYMTPELEPILSSTYGTIVYQEQVMAIVQKLAGYTLGRADLVRRAMGKKKIEVMNQEKNYFIHGKLHADGSVDVPGCVRNGIPEDVATEIWNQMEDFSKYAFNKSHAAAYAVIASVTGWLKTYYPVDFMSSVLNTFTGKAEKLANYLAVCKEMGVKILPPDVNKSDVLFSRFRNDIAFALKGIRNVGATSALIVTEREARGPFADFEDFAIRMAKHEKITKRATDGLTYSGALDGFEGTRRAKIQIAPLLLQKASEDKAIFESGQITWFDLDESLAEKNKISIPKMEEFEKKTKLKLEKEYAGFYVTEHPLDEYAKYFKDKDITEIGFITETNDEEDGLEVIEKESFHGKHVTLAGIIEEVKVFYTKKDNKPINVFTLEGRSGKIECVVFADKLEANRGKIQVDKIVMVEGTIKEDEFKTQCIVTGIMDIEAIANAKKEPKLIAIRLENHEAYKFFKNEVLEDKTYRGDVPTFVVIGGKKFKSNTSLNYSLGTITKLNNLYGENCKVVY